MKKYLFYILILITLIALFSPAISIYAQTPDGTCVTDKNTYQNTTQAGCDLVAKHTGETVVSWTPNNPLPSNPLPSNTLPLPSAPTSSLTSPASPNTNYQLLAPLPCESGPGCNNKQLTNIETAGEGGGALGGYLNLMIKLFIGICAVLAVVMIVMGGVQYMTSELISSKEAGRERILHAVLGLLLALGAYTLLYTINPDLLKSDLSKLSDVTVEVTLDQANFSITEKTATLVGTKYTLNRNVSSGVSDFIKNYGASLANITVDTATGKASFCAGTNCVSVPINIGQGGVATAGNAKAGDLKTPIGTTVIGGDIRIGSNGNAVISQGGYNLGAAFINIGATINGADRGIGFHGSYDDNMGKTNGCIRMSNEDLIALAPYMKAGVKVTIK